MITDQLEERRAELRRLRKLPEADRRREGTQATRDRFYGQTFDWAKGMHCVKLAHAHLRNMGKRPPALPKVTGPDEARKALKKRGWAGVSDMLDSLLERIPPAMMRVGDLGVIEGDEGFESVVVLLGPRKVLGWLPQGFEVVTEVRADGTQTRRSGMVIYDTGLDVLTGAWRV